MKSQATAPPQPQTKNNLFDGVRVGIGPKIILPYLLLTLVVASLGAFVVVRLVTNSLEERFNNQLLDAGRIVSEQMVDYEELRLEILRVVAATEGVPEALAAGNRNRLAEMVPQIIANSNTDAVELVDLQGREIYGWQRPPNQAGVGGEERAGADFSQFPEVRRVLDGFEDDLGDRLVLLIDTNHGMMIFTVGPVYLENQRVGAVLVGTYISEMLADLTETAVARVTLYNPMGEVIGTTLGRGQEDFIAEPRDRYNTILTLLQEFPQRYPIVVAQAEEEVPLREIQVLGQSYTLAYGDWRLRDQSFGLFSVALPNNFIVSTAAWSGNILAIIFASATVAVFVLGFIIAQRIVTPLHHLVTTSTAIVQGDLERRTGITRGDEIGNLAQSFDTMTDHLVERNRQLLEQATKLEAILNSIADGVVVLDRQGSVISSNPAAQQILAETSDDILTKILNHPSSAPALAADNTLPNPEQTQESVKIQQPERYYTGNRVLSALTAPVKTADGEDLGTVIALRDITREAEIERLKDVFIQQISHELRTPLTAVKGYSELLLMLSDNNRSEKQYYFMESIDRSAGILMHHVNKIIDISQIQAGTLRLNKLDVNLNELVEEGTESWRKKLEDNDLSLHVMLPAENLYVCGDPDRLSWALDNLLSNAYNYTLPNGQVNVHLFKANNQGRIDVTDTGIGLAESDQPYLFTPFFRAGHQSAYEVAGVGLGLFITRSIIEAHSGQAWAWSELNIGSRFSLALPLVEHNSENS